MRRKESIIITFVLLFILFFGFNFFGRTGVVMGIRGVFEKIFSPFQSATLGIAHIPYNLFQKGEITSLKNQNRELLTQLTQLNKLKEDNHALSDQFAVTSPQSISLIQAHIIGMPEFIPGVTSADQLVLDKGSSDGIAKGYAVIVGQNFLGRITNVSANRSLVDLVSYKNSSFTVKTSQTNALGVLKGQGGGDVVLNNVLLSDSLKISDLVVTRGDENIDGVGAPADLIIGKIISIDKKASDLFQSAKIKSLIDVTSLSLVFILKP